MPSVTDEKSLGASSPSVDPYEVLGLDPQATAQQVRSAYRKQALKHHPDKCGIEAKDAANVQFQKITFAYAILSDSRRRGRYDATGNTSESLDVDDDEFDWREFFRAQKAEMLDGKAIQKIKDEYQHSGDEHADLLAAFEHSKGDMDIVYAEMMCSNVLEDDERFRTMIDEAIENKQVKAWKKYAKETAGKKRVRLDKAKKEELEAREYAEELGVADQLFGHARAQTGKENENLDLMALVQQRQKSRQEQFLDGIEAKYGGTSKSKKGTKRTAFDEPPEEAFAANRRKQAKA